MKKKTKSPEWHRIQRLKHLVNVTGAEIYKQRLAAAQRQLKDDNNDDTKTD